MKDFFDDLRYAAAWTALLLAIGVMLTAAIDAAYR